MSQNISYIIGQVFFQKIYIQGSIRSYSRWMHRKPVKVLLPFESKSEVSLKKERIIELDLNNFKESQVNETPKKKSKDSPKNLDTLRDASVLSAEQSKEIKQKRELKITKQKFYLSQKKIFDDDGQIMYEKLKENDGNLSALMVKVKSKKDRAKSGLVTVEGWRLIVDGLEAKCPLKYVIFSRVEDLNNLRPFLPKTGVLFYKISYKEIQLWSDVETSPGIIGLFETPTAENIKRLSKPLPLDFICDSIRVPGNLGAILRAAVGVGCDKVLLSKGCVDLWDPKVIRSAAGAHFRLPIQTSIDWDDMSNHLQPNTSIFIADSNTQVDAEASEKELALNAADQIPVLPYYGLQFSTLKHITLILGGETEGISEDSYMLAAQNNGLRLNIPLSRGVDSLNTGMATAVIAFEIRKQLIQAWTKIKLERQTRQATGT